MRIAMGVEYAGTRYAGWQEQRHADSVQGALEAALSRVAAEPVEVVASGRTDAGVHALGQVVHFDTTVHRPLRGWCLGGTTHLPDDIAITWAREVPASFDARRSAESRRYRYVLMDRLTRPAWLTGRVGWTWRRLDAAPMHAAARSLIGEHDFEAFRAAACQAAHARRCLNALTVSRCGDYLHFDLVANAFLHHMVRNIVGSLMAVGAGEREPGWIDDVLASRDRRRAGMTAPAAGLYLVGPRYPEAFGLPEPPPPPRFA